MDRREFLKNLAISTSIAQAATIPLLDGLDLPPAKEVSIPPMWLRTMYMRKEYDFERDGDKILLALRFAKLDHFARSSVPYKKHAIAIILPKDTPTPGLDALSLLLQGISKC